MSRAGAATTALALAATLHAVPAAAAVPQIHALSPAADIAGVVGDNILVLIHHAAELNVRVDGESSAQQVRYVSGLTVVDAPAAAVAAVVHDYPNYHEFVPQTLGGEVLGRAGNQETVEIELGFDLPVFSLGIDYTAEYTHHSTYDTSWDVIDGDLQGSVGRWEILPIGPNRTLLAYTIWTNFDELGFLVRTAFKVQPDLRFALPAATAAVVVRAMRERIERRPLANGQPQRQPVIPLISRGDVNAEALKSLAQAGTLIVVYPEQQLVTKDQQVSLPFVSAGALVQAPLDPARRYGTSFDRYPEFFDQVRGAKALPVPGRNLVAWSLGIEFGFLSIPIDYTVEYVQASPQAWPFRRTAGDFEFLYGALEWIPVDAENTLLVYTTASAPGKNGANILKIADMIPNNQMIAGVSAAAVVVERQAPWIEQRLAEQRGKATELRAP